MLESAIRMELYTSRAKRLQNTIASRVEIEIRHVIEVKWGIGSIEAINRLIF
ncbi:sporulation initiation factor Spo0A C-terminal domain-containing protein [Clostridium botulinum]|uniref:sporulation initiation factor Spo0A C-terminal domain-containing protein n=1 Tax=Clostridium botulinum TaxID=1491 RepID=UPI000ABCC1F0